MISNLSVAHTAAFLPAAHAMPPCVRIRRSAPMVGMEIWYLWVAFCGRAQGPSLHSVEEFELKNLQAQTPNLPFAADGSLSGRKMHYSLMVNHPSTTPNYPL